MASMKGLGNGQNAEPGDDSDPGSHAWVRSLSCECTVSSGLPWDNAEGRIPRSKVEVCQQSLDLVPHSEDGPPVNSIKIYHEFTVACHDQSHINFNVLDEAGARIGFANIGREEFGNEEEADSPKVHQLPILNEFGEETGALKVWFQPLDTNLGYDYATVCAGGEPEMPGAMVTHHWANKFYHLLAAAFADALGYKEFETVVNLLNKD